MGWQLWINGLGLDLGNVGVGWITDPRFGSGAGKWGFRAAQEFRAALGSKVWVWGREMCVRDGSGIRFEFGAGKCMCGMF